MTKRIFTLLLITFSLAGCTNHSSSSHQESSPTVYQQNLMDEGWVISSPQQGDMPEEYGISAKKGILDNYFDIELGGDLDMAVKIVNIETERPIRYVYVPAGSTTTINELPKGKYYLKLTYGKDWMISYDGNKTIGKFTREANYEKTTSMFDFGDKNTLDAVSYSLKIHIEQDSRYENLSTTEISEQEFFND